MDVHEPRIPFLMPINGRLVPGNKITVVGWPKEKCNCFQINLKLGAEVQDEIALHMNAHFKPSVKTPFLVRNTLTSAGWGKEEKDTPFFPFLTKQTFKLEIVCEPARFLVLINDQLFCRYTHRLPLAYVTHLEVTGDVEISCITVSENNF